MKVFLLLLFISLSTFAKEKVLWLKSPIYPIYTEDGKSGIGDSVQTALQNCLTDYEHETRTLSNQLRLFKTLKQNDHTAICNPLFAQRIEDSNQLTFSKPIVYSPAPVLIILKKNKDLFLKKRSKVVSLNDVLNNSDLKGIYNASTHFGSDLNKIIKSFKERITPLYKSDLEQH